MRQKPLNPAPGIEARQIRTHLQISRSNLLIHEGIPDLFSALSLPLRFRKRASRGDLGHLVPGIRKNQGKKKIMN